MTTMMKTIFGLAALLGLPAVVTAVDIMSATIDAALSMNDVPLMMQQQQRNGTDVRKNQKRGPTFVELEQQQEERLKRSKERRDQARKKIASLQPDISQLERLTKEELESLTEDEEDHPWIRRAGWRGDDYSAYSLNMADPSKSYDRWSQAYRMLGGFIDCDHTKTQKNDHNKNNNNGQNQQQQGTGCSRWMMWAAVSEL